MRVVKDAKVFMSVAKMFKKISFIFEVLPIILLLVTMVLFLLALRPTLVEIVKLPIMAAPRCRRRQRCRQERVCGVSAAS